MNISDLQQVLRERAGEASSDQPDVDLLVEQGQARRRRRRIAAVAAAVVLVAAGVSIPVLLSGGSDSGGGPATLVPTITSPATPAPSTQSSAPSAGPTSSPPSVVPSASVTTAPVAGVTPSALPSLTPSTVPPSAPSVDASILVYGDCRTPTLEPSEIVVTCADHGFFFQGLQWTSWTSTSATATGTEVYNDCTPSCAEGHFHSVPNASVTLALPVRDSAGQLLWSQIQFSPQPPGYATGPYHGGPEPLPLRPE